MQEIIKILMRRDKINKEEAISMIQKCQEELENATTIEEAEDSIAYWLGLEPDYLPTLLMEEI